MKAKHLLITLIGLFLLTSNVTYAGGDKPKPNSESNPYYIRNYNDLKHYSDLFNAADKYRKKDAKKYQNAYYKITANITIPANSNWASIGSSSTPFQGYIDGQNHTITIQGFQRTLFGVISKKNGRNRPYLKNLRFTASATSGGVVAHSTNADFTNIHATATFVNQTSNTSFGSISSISNGSNFTNCSYTGTIQNNVSSSKIGGIVGQANQSTFENCSVSGTVQNNAYNSKVGGIVGYATNSTINNTTNNATIQNNSSNGNIGGIIGEISNSTITNSNNKGLIRGSNNTNGIIGGIVAKSTNSSINTCNNEGSLSMANMIGGIVGMNTYTHTKNCTNKAPITNANIIGGIIGEYTTASADAIWLDNCHNNENANLSNAIYIGGLIGINNKTIVMRESSNKANINTNNIAGGLVAKTSHHLEIYNSINIGNISTGSSNNNSIIGGIIGEGNTHIWIRYVGNYGKITGINGYTSGIVGKNNSSYSIIEYVVQSSNIRANNTNKIFPISNRGTFTQCYFDKELTSSTASNGKYTAELKNNSLRRAASGNGYTDQNWDFTQGYYLVPKPFGHFGNIDPNIGLTPITDAVTVVFMNNNQVYDYQKDQTTIQFPNNPTGFDGYSFIGWSYDDSNITLASDDSQIFVEKLNHKTNTELKLFAVWSKDSQWTTTASVKELVIEDQMTLNQDASYSQIIVKPGATLVIGYNVTITCDRLTLIGRNFENDQVQAEVKFLDDVSELHVTNGWMYARLTNGFNFTYFSLPYDCTKADVYTLESEKAAYGSNWIVKSYNAEKRATSGTGTTNWIYETGPTIEAGIGYIFGTTFDNNQTFYFKPSTKQTILKFDSKMLKVKPTKKQNQKVSDNNWNLCGNFYTSSLNCTPSFSTDDNSRAPRHIFISVPDAENNGSTFSYLSTMEGNFTIPAFSVFYTQAITSGKINIDAQQEVSNAPQRAMQVPSANSQIFNDLTFTCINDQTQAKDNMGISLSDQGLLAYELGFDYEKRVGLQDKPQIYTIAENNKLAYNDIAYSDAVNLPMGLYAPIGNYTLSMNRMEQNGIQSVFLLDNETGMTIDLMTQDYTFQVQTAEETMTRFNITVVQGTATPTEIENTESQDNISITTNEIGFVINNAPLNSRFLVVDASGRMIAQGTTIDVLQTIEINNSGIYMIQVQTPEGLNHTYKTIK